MNQKRVISNVNLHSLVNTKSDYPNYTLPFAGELNIFSVSRLMQQGDLSITTFTGPVSISYAPGEWTQVNSRELICAIYKKKAYVVISIDKMPVVCETFDMNTMSSILIDQPPEIDCVVNLDDARR
jgi:hypothetical protein